MKFYPASSAQIQIDATAISTGSRVITSAVARNSKGGITGGEFRALFFAPGSAFPTHVDLRTPAEGGTFTHNGVTQLIITALPGDNFGAQYAFTSATPGRWFYAWNLSGALKSLWSDGNLTPQFVYDFIDTIIDVSVDAGPPSGWTVLLMKGPRRNTYIATATRPTTNGNIIRGIAFQIKNSAAGAWRLLDANAGAAVTQYDGSAIAHILSTNGKRLTRSAGAGFGTAVIGSMILVDVRGGAFNVQYCQQRVIIAFEGGNPATATWCEFDTALEPQVTANLNAKIVLAPWNWGAGDGYLGGTSNLGWKDTTYPGAGSISGDVFSGSFTSPPIEVPAAVIVPQVRVFFTNNYSTSDNALTVSSGIGEALGINTPIVYTDFTDGNLWIPINADPANFVMAIATTGVSLSSTKAYGIPRSEDLFAGVISRNIYYPDPVTGVLSLQCYFDSVNVPTDLTVANDVFLMGMMIMIVNQGLTGSNYDNNVIVGWGKLISLLPSKYATNIGSAGVSTGPTAIGTSVLNGTSAVVANGATFSITMNFGARTKVAGTIRSYGLTTYDVVGTNGIPTESFPIVGGDVFVPFGMPAFLQGIRLAVGMWPSHNSNQGSARLVSVSLINGRAYRTDFGISPPSPVFSAPGGSGIRIFTLRLPGY